MNEWRILIGLCNLSSKVHCTCRCYTAYVDFIKNYETRLIHFAIDLSQVLLSKCGFLWCSIFFVLCRHFTKPRKYSKKSDIGSHEPETNRCSYMVDFFI